MQPSLFGTVVEEARHLPQSQLDAIEREIQAESQKIGFFTTEQTLEVIASKMNRGDMYVPEYQREFNWTSSTRSRFVESLMLRLPIPFLFFWEAGDGRLEIVDGSQRIRTISSFLSNRLRLGKLERLQTCSGVVFSELPIGVQRKLNNTPIRGIVMDEHADSAARRDLFDRINTSGLRLQPAEVRRGVNHGPFLELVITLTKDPVFQRIAPMTPSDKGQRLDEELISRFFAYSGSLDGYQDNVKKFIADFTDKQNRALLQDPDLVVPLLHQFHSTMKFVDRVFPYGVRKSPKGNKTYSARFESITVGGNLALQANPSLMERNVDVLGWLHSDSFEEVVSSDGANVRSKLVRRIHYVRDRLLES